MRDSLGVPDKSRDWKNKPRKSDADDPYLRDRREIDQRKTQIFRCDPATRRRKDEMPVEQIGRGHSYNVGDDDRDFVGHRERERDAAQDIDERRGAARAQEQKKTPAFRRVHGTRSAISLPKRALSAMPRSSG